MKVFIALALVSVALATPVIQPVQLPAAPLPAMEAAPYVARPEPIDISPVFVPVEVMEALRLQEIPSDILAEVAHIDTAFEALKVVNLEEVVAAYAEEIPAEPVNIVEVAENIDVAPFAAEELAAPSAEEIPAEAVKIVDLPQIIEADIAEEEVAAPIEDVVEYADNIDAAQVAADELAAPSNEEIPAEAVNFVEIAENIEAEVVADEVAAAAEEVPADAVKIVEVAENVEAAVADTNVDSVPQDVVRVVDAPLMYPGKVYDNPMLR